MSKFGKLAQVVGKVSTTLTKHSPVIFTVAGVAGIGTTAVMSYKSRDKILTIVERIEEDKDRLAQYEDISARINDTTVRLSDEEHRDYTLALDEISESLETNPAYTKGEIAKDVVSAVAAPVFVGVLSIAAIILSYQIQNNRIGSLAAALATSATENAIFKKKYKEKHGEEEYYKFANTKRESVTYENAKGKEVTKEVDVRDMTNSLTEYWFDQSQHYVSDDIDYNQSFINHKLSNLDLAVFQRGVLPLNAALQALGFPPTKAGSAIGWTSGSFHAETRHVQVWSDKTNREETELLVVFSQPVMIFDKEDYTETLMGLC